MVGVLDPTLTSLRTEPSIVVVDVGCIFTGLGAVVPRMSTVTTNFARWVRAHGMDGMHSALGSRLGTLLVLALVGDHLFDQGRNLGNSKVQIGSSSSSIEMVYGCCR